MYMSCYQIDIILWHYGRSKNYDSAISESKVIEIVASKFGISNIGKGHTLYTINYPTLRSQKQNLK